MGNYKFKLSDMIPNAWFYKLKDMSKNRNQRNTQPLIKKTHINPTSSSSSSTTAAALNHHHHQPESKPEKPHLSDQRKSYYFTRDLVSLPPNHQYTNSPTKLKLSDAMNHPAEPPRKSSRRRRSIKRSRRSTRQSPRLVTSSVSASCSCRASLESVWNKPDSTTEDSLSSDQVSLLPEYGSDRSLTPDTFDGMLSWSTTSCQCQTKNQKIMDTDIRNKPFHEKFDGLNTVSGFDHLPPIITKPGKVCNMKTDMKTEGNGGTKIRRTSAKFEERNEYGSLSVKVVKEDILRASRRGEHKTNTITSPVRKSLSNSPGLRLRTNSPRILNRKIQGRRSVSSTSSASSRKSVTDSYAIVKSSQNPKRDFRESMVEMILENNIRASKELEDLLACYLSLNSDEYHDLIINVFKQIWFEIIDLGIK